MDRIYRLGFLLGILLSLTAGHYFFNSRPAVAGLEPLLSLDELAFDASWIMAGLVAVFLIVMVSSFWKAIRRSADAELKEPGFSRLESMR